MGLDSDPIVNLDPSEVEGLCRGHTPARLPFLPNLPLDEADTRDRDQSLGRA
jgi:hypothetical protein